MPFLSQKYPILEYDSDPRGVIMPNREAKYALPPKAAFAFLLDSCIDGYAESHGWETAAEYETVTKTFPIYQGRYKGQEMVLCQAPLGAPAAVQILDFLIACGIRQVISTGSCGVLVDLPENGFLVPNRALRDEGTSYHYLPPSRFVDLSPEAVEAIGSVFRARSLPFRLCSTWTTDGFYRETPAVIRRRLEEGCEAVEMECAGLAACARMRGVDFGQILFSADSLADVDAHDAREWGRGSHSLALELSLESLITL